MRMADEWRTILRDLFQGEINRLERKKCRGCKPQKLPPFEPPKPVRIPPVKPAPVVKPKIGKPPKPPRIVPPPKPPRPVPPSRPPRPPLPFAVPAALPLLETYDDAVCLLHKLTDTYPFYREILIDADDFERLSQDQWRLAAVGPSREPRVTRCKDNQYLHRVVASPPDNMFVDHMYHNLLDARKKRLRVCTHKQNAGNVRARRHTTSKYRGLTWDKKRRKWIVNCGRGTPHYLYAVFDDEKEAAMAYNAYAAAVYGDFAYLNRF